MHNKIIGVSVFGINDGIYIDDVDIGIKDFIPNVVIEDFDNKVYMYSNSAKFDKSGLSLDRESYNQSANSRKMIALLWQQLELSEEKGTLANLLFKYILETIKETLNSNQITKDKITIYDLKKSYTIVLCIPDTCGVSEQDAILQAFNGYDIKLVWRSVASLLAYYEDESISKSKTASDGISVLYIGPDSIDVIEYGVDVVEYNSKTYYVPKRYQAVYESNQIPINGTDLTIALVQDLINSQYPYIEKSVNDKFVRQVLYRFASVWGGENRANIINTIFCCSDGKYEYKTVSLNLKSNSSDIKYTDIINEIYKDNDLKDVTFKRQSNNYVFELLRNEIYQRCTSSTILCTGPLVESKIIINNVIDYVSNRHYTKSFTICTNMAYGAVIYYKRQQNGEPTYKEKVDRFSYIASNESNDGYVAVTLLEDKFIEPTLTYKSDPVKLLLRKGSKEIKLFVSNDNNFTQKVLDKADTISFKEQHIKVLEATPKKFKRNVDEDINVQVHIEQKLLSGYIKVIITPLDDKENEFIPKGGISVSFDKEHQELYEGTLEYKNTAYNKYHVAQLSNSVPYPIYDYKKEYFQNRFGTSNSNVSFKFNKCFYNKFDRVDDLIIQKVDEFNESIVTESFVDQIKKSILIDKGKISPRLKREIYNSLTSENYSKADYNILLNGYIRAMADDDIDNAIELLEKYKALNTSAYQILTVCRNIVMFNPRLFNPTSKSFNFPETLKDIMFDTAISFLSKSDDTKEFYFDVNKNRRTISIKGRNKTITAFSTFIYILWYRKSPEGRMFLTDDYQINNINNILSKIINCYKKSYSDLLKRYKITVQPSNSKAVNKLEEFISKLEKMHENLISLLNQKGTDYDILAISEELLSSDDE